MLRIKPSSDLTTIMLTSKLSHSGGVKSGRWGSERDMGFQKCDHYNKTKVGRILYLGQNILDPTTLCIPYHPYYLIPNPLIPYYTLSVSCVLIFLCLKLFDGSIMILIFWFGSELSFRSSE